MFLRRLLPKTNVFLSQRLALYFFGGLHRRYPISENSRNFEKNKSSIQKMAKEIFESARDEERQTAEAFQARLSFCHTPTALESAFSAFAPFLRNSAGISAQGSLEQILAEVETWHANYDKKSVAKSSLR